MPLKDPIARAAYSKMNMARWRARKGEEYRQYQREYRRTWRTVGNNRRNEQATQAVWKSANPTRIAKYRQRAERKRNGGDVKKTAARNLCRSRRRSRKTGAAGYCSLDQWMARIVYYGWRCGHCGKKLQSRTLTRDHIIPLAKGGSEWPSNLVPSCKSCNSKKGNRTMTPKVYR